MDKHLGDIDGDGKVDKNDLEILKNLVRNKPLFEQLSDEEKKMLDINQDGEVNYDDVIQLIQVIKSHVDSEGQIPEKEMSDCLTKIRQRLRSI